MACKKFVAILAGIVDAAASHPDSNDVNRGVIMDAPGLRVYFHPVDIRFWRLHILIRTQGRSPTVFETSPPGYEKNLLPLRTPSKSHPTVEGTNSYFCWFVERCLMLSRFAGQGRAVATLVRVDFDGVLRGLSPRINPFPSNFLFSLWT
jgi:hypothetical protein